MMNTTLIKGVGFIGGNGIGLQALEECIENGGEWLAGGFDISNVNLDDYVKMRTKSFDDVSTMALIATSLACRQAGWGDIDSFRTGVVIGTTRGNADSLQEYLKDESASPLKFVHSFINAPAGLVSQVYKMNGVHSLLCSGDSSGLQALRYASYLISSGKSDFVITGAVDNTEKKGVDGSEGVKAACLLAMERGSPRGKGFRLKFVFKVSVTENTQLVCENFRKYLCNGSSEMPIVEKVYLSSHSSDEVLTKEMEIASALGVPDCNCVSLHRYLGRKGAVQGVIGVALGISAIQDKASRVAIVNALQGDKLTMLVIEGQ